MNSGLVDSREFLAEMLADDGPAFVATPVDVTLDFTIKKFALQILLQKASTAISTRDVSPVLTNFQITAAPGLLQVVGSDTERTVVATTEIVTVAQPGVAVFPARKMLDILDKARDGLVHVQVRKFNAAITIGPTLWNLALLPGHDYPALDDISEATFATVNRLQFAAALKTVKYAASTDDIRTTLCMVDVTDSRMTACDGSRLQQATTAEIAFNFQIPILAVTDLLKLLQTVDVENIQIGDIPHRLIFRFGSDMLIAKKLESQFSNVSALLLRPALANKYRLTVDREDLVAAIRRVRITADKDTSAIALRLDRDLITVVARDAMSNDATETLPAGWDAPSRTVVVHHGFLLDMLARYDQKDCTFLLGEDSKSKKMAVMLRDETAGTVGVIQQMHADWVGA